MICDVHNHGFDYKLVNYLIVTHLDFEEKKIIDEMTINIVQP